MPDASLVWGGDLAVGPTGDIATASDSELGQQRVLRRLLTNPSDYLWYPRYGGGVAQFIGAPCDVSAIISRVRSQIFMEASVARSPEPQIDVQSAADGSVYVQIRYVDAPTGSSQSLSFSMSA